MNIKFAGIIVFIGALLVVNEVSLAEPILVENAAIKDSNATVKNLVSPSKYYDAKAKENETVKRDGSEGVSSGSGAGSSRGLFGITPLKTSYKESISILKRCFKNPRIQYISNGVYIVRAIVESCPDDFSYGSRCKLSVHFYNTGENTVVNDMRFSFYTNQIKFFYDILASKYLLKDGVMYRKLGGDYVESSEQSDYQDEYGSYNAYISYPMRSYLFDGDNLRIIYSVPDKYNIDSVTSDNIEVDIDYYNLNDFNDMQRKRKEERQSREETVKREQEEEITKLRSIF